MNLDFLMINISGFLQYSIYSLYGYFVDDSQTGLVKEADLFFALHAFAATLFTAAQVLIYPKGSNRLTIRTKRFVLGQWAFLGCYLALTHVLLGRFRVDGLILVDISEL